MSDHVLERLAHVVRGEGGLLAQALREPAADAQARLGELAAAGPRAAGHGADVALVVEAVHEGYLLHHAQSRLFDTSDPDLALLAGDRLYAMGLERLAEAGDLESVSVLSEVIALCAQAHAAQDRPLAEAAWEAGAAQVGWGRNCEIGHATAAARSGEGGAAIRLLSATRRIARAEI